MIKVSNGIAFAIKAKAEKITKLRNVTITSRKGEHYVADSVTFAKFASGKDVRASVDGESYFIIIERCNNALSLLLTHNTNADEVYEVTKEEGNSIYKQIKSRGEFEIK